MITKATDRFNRFEVKYLVGAAELPALLAELELYTRRDPHMQDPQGYRVHSVYWDSPGFALFWEKVEGLEIRRKLRFRSYDDSPVVFAEIKQRVDRTLQKRRVRLPVDQAERILRESGSLSLGEEQLADPVAQEVEGFARQYMLRPVVAITYRRLALVGSETADLRITFDRRVQYSTGELTTRPLRQGSYLLDPRMAIMEVKYNGRVPRWLSKLVSREGLQLRRLSKYCSAIDRVHFGGQVT
jgi:hypothetical protein